MKRGELASRLGKGPLVLDGATGTQLMRAGLPQGVLPEQWVLERPDAIRNLAASYAQAGSDAVYTCTFGASRVNLGKHGLGEREGEVVRRAVELAREGVAGRAQVFASVGPLGELIEPLGDLPEEDARAAYRQQVELLLVAGVDAVVVESQTSLAEAVLAVREARATGDTAVLATMSFEGPDKDYRTVMGDTAVNAARTLRDAGADAVGVNCGRGGADALEVVKRMREAVQGVPLVAKPNAGLPVLRGGEMSYPTAPEAFAREGLALREAGAKLLGGCCGTTPGHLAALVAALRGRGS